MESGRFNILILEDSPEDAELIIRALKDNAFSCTSKVVTDMKTFVEALNTFSPDLILSDYHLPGFTGKVALQIALSYNQEIPFIFVSGAIGEERAVEVMKDGATDYVLKDNLGKLRHSVIRVMRERQLALGKQQVQENLRKSEEQLKQITSSIPGLVYRYERRRESRLKYTFVSDNSNFIWGIPSQQIMHDPEVIFSRFFREDIPKVNRTYLEGDLSQQYVNMLFRIRWIDGTVKWLRDNSLAVEMPDGTIVRTGTISDVTILHEAEMQVKNFSKYLNSAIEEERTRLSREIHDELGQQLTGLKLGLSALRTGLQKNPESADLITELIQSTDALIQNVRSISTQLRPAILDTLGLSASLQWYIGEVAKRGGLMFEYTSNMKEKQVDKEVSTALFRIAQEALTNVLRHSLAKSIYVDLMEEDGILELLISDDGKGIQEMDVRKVFSNGIMGMKERARLIGGALTIQTGKRGTGTAIKVRVPLFGSS